ncbi:ABC transporter permease subunit [Thomasclavelia cocleata]|uniref:ABC transporter permease n=1 Tax=Thomasclavelia cocleata TaxID=69824 RepID=UPI00256EECFB|nr:ABC transporter permease subunit [Thomasclavelia cocleata]
MKRKIFTLICILGIWQGFSLLINKEVILPLPLVVLNKMLDLVLQKDFYLAIFSTIIRVIISFVIALILGTILGIFSGLNKKVNDYLSSIISLLQTIPQIAYILILLVWFKSLTALIIIVLLMLIPVFYNNAVNGIKNIQPELKDVINLYHHSVSFNLIHVYIPLIKGYIISAIETCLPLSLKVGVMAEIFVSSSFGIGKQLYLARVQIDMVSIFAWTIWMIIIINAINYLTNLIIKARIK